MTSLLISNLPLAVTEEESRDLLSNFGAEEVKVFKRFRRKKAIFARFQSTSDAQHALQQLHQADLGGSRLVVEYADSTLQIGCSWQSEDQSAPIKHQLTSTVDQLAVFPFPCPTLHYAYPPPTADTLARISSALLSRPRFYTQVLHLMNKMSLPAPFAAASPAATPAAAPQPPLAARHDVAVQTEPIDSSFDSAESELVSDNSDAAPERRPKRRRLARLPAAAAAAVPLSEVFEAASIVTPARRPVLRLPAERPPLPPANGTPPAVQVGFAKLYPSRAEPGTAEAVATEPRPELEFISDRQLAENRISAEDMKVLPVFSRYTPGDESARLYIKNLDKRVAAGDLRHVFGRYLDWTDEHHKNAFDIRLMQEGRMKGQAFVSLPSPKVARLALAETNGFILKDKPMVVQFARSARSQQVGS
ncbi:RNA-binding region-containing protein 3-like [Pollicipes pollicipes]|uniref:RNA-binding region-containing protein 3-like n=1 Tax=Pollicipes pollicipes TaxID=41117 RepID=UPI0018850E31|nr:RNA-binding region-containing protein 3-like [Pollicipes pollicipes]